MNQVFIVLAEASYPFVCAAISGGYQMQLSEVVTHPSRMKRSPSSTGCLPNYQHKIELISVEPQPDSGGPSLRLAGETFPHRAGPRTWLDRPGRL